MRMVYFLAPMQPLALLMVTTLHWVSPATREILILLSQFQSIGADTLAARVARRSRHQLARMLARDGLPGLKKLRMWVRVIGWTVAWEYYHTSLYRSAIAQDMDPAIAYRAVKKVTGLSWRVVLGRRCYIIRDKYAVDRMVDYRRGTQALENQGGHRRGFARMIERTDESFHLRRLGAESRWS